MNDRVAQCLLVAKVLVADGMMTEQEKLFLAGMMDKLELSAAERTQVLELDGWDEAEQAALALPLPTRKLLLDELEQAALADGRLSPLELKMMKEIVEKLGLA